MKASVHRVGTSMVLNLRFSVEEARELANGIVGLFRLSEDQSGWSWPNTETALLDSTLTNFLNNYGRSK